MATLNIEQLKSEAHRVLISKLDLEKLSRVNSNQARQAVASMVNEIIGDQRVPLSLDEQDRIQADLLDEVFGLGPLEPLLRDSTVSDILVNGRATCVHRARRNSAAGECHVPRRSPPAADHRPHRIAGGPAAWTSRLRWWMRDCPMVRASTRLFRRWLWMVRRFPFAALERAHFRLSNWWS